MNFIQKIAILLVTFMSLAISLDESEIYFIKGVPNTVLVEAARVAVEASKWKPAKHRGKKVGVWITIPVRFEL